MISGIGVDIVENKRIQFAVERYGERFLKRVFTDNEIKYCMEKFKSYPCLAARFAAKEAFIKASNGLNISHLHDIEVLRNVQGKPSINLLGRAKEFMTFSNIHLSITHEKEYSVAMVVIEQAI
ncbi:MAG: holo-ACP synthase [Nitrospirae bacterium]|nr:holo-ACP synthase [Nitrospirota bacterium]